MTDRPIIFSATMVRAILAGRKTQTRRIISRARVFGTPERPSFSLTGQGLARAMQNADRFRHMGGDSWFWESDAFKWQAPHTRTGWLAHIGYAPGDLLWVRETYYQFGHWEPVPGATTKGGKQKWGFVPNMLVQYEAPRAFRSAMRRDDPYTAAWHKRLGRFMPRHLSRITLRVTGVKVERLQDISEADAIAEGIAGIHHGDGDYYYSAVRDEPHPENWCAPEDAFKELWETINGPGSWNDNPWVVAISFEPIFKNIDQVERADD